MTNTEELMTRFNITRRKLDYWYRKGYLSPDGKEPEGIGDGRGTPRSYTFEQEVVLARMVLLVNAGVVASVASAIARGEQEPFAQLLSVLENCR